MTATLFSTSFEDPTLVPIGDWMPSRFTPTLTGTPLTADGAFFTDADRFLPIVAKYWRTPETIKFLADPWQVWLLRRVLEVYPPDWPVEKLRGKLRYRQVVISVARQNGKSVLGALLAFYFLAMHVRGPRVVGLASLDRQAKIVYDRVYYAIENCDTFKRTLRATQSRGIKWRNGNGVYQTLPAKEESAQGEPISGALYDELHLGDAGLWDAIVLGQKARENSILAGITTAGDDDSDLLIRLYSDGQAAIDGDDERFGFFCWEAEDDNLTQENLIRANPAIACGRIDLDTAWADAVKLWRAPADKRGVTGKDRCLRYTLNRFVQGSATSWASIAAWNDGAMFDPPEHPSTASVVYGIERTANWEHVSITATTHRDGLVTTELVATLAEPDHDTLLAVGDALAKRGTGAAFVVDKKTMEALGKGLKDNGHDVWMLGANEMQAAAATARALIGRRAVLHPGDALVKLQMSQARRRDLDEKTWRISRTLSTGDIDTVLGMVMGIHVAAIRPDHTHQMF